MGEKSDFEEKVGLLGARFGSILSSSGGNWVLVLLVLLGVLVTVTGVVRVRRKGLMVNGELGMVNG